MTKLHLGAVRAKWQEITHPNAEDAGGSVALEVELVVEHREGAVGEVVEGTFGGLVLGLLGWEAEADEAPEAGFKGDGLDIAACELGIVLGCWEGQRRERED